MIKKIAFLLAVPFLVEIAISCCPDNPVAYYTHKAFEVSHLDNSGQMPVGPTGGSVPKEAYAIRLTVFRERTAFNALRIRSHLFQPALAAVDCDDDTAFYAKDDIQTIAIITLDDFDVTHTAGSDISAYFKVYNTTNSFLTIGEFLSNPVYTYFGNEMNINYNFLLMEPPISPSPRRFKVLVGLTDGRAFEVETTEISLI